SLHCFVSGFAVEAVERFLIVSTVRGRFFGFELCKHLSVPESQMTGKLTYRVIAALVLPLRLVSGNALNRDADRHEPIFLVVSGTKAFRQDALEVLRRLRLPLVLAFGAGMSVQGEY